jgi:hypothetical protein
MFLHEFVTIASILEKLLRGDKDDALFYFDIGFEFFENED